MIYDVIIIGAGAAGLFAGINLPKDLNKLILEKNDKPGIKVLLSGGERANVSNIDIEPMRDYFGQNKKALLSVFNKYNQWDIQSFFAQSGVNIVEEDRGRLILESGDSKELLELLLRKSRENNCKLKCGCEVFKITPPTYGDYACPSESEGTPGKREKLKEKGNKGSLFQIKTIDSTFEAKNVIISSGGKSFFQVGTTGDSYRFAEDLDVKIISPHRGLCGLVTKRDFSALSGSSLDLNFKIFDTSPLAPLLIGEGKIKGKLIYEEKGPFLFTHYGISGPIVFNASIALGEYLNKKNINSEEEKIKYIKDNIIGEIEINPNSSTKKINKFFEEEIEENKIKFGFQDWRSWKEAKITGGGVDINELDNHMQVKKIPGLYFIGESVDITGKTGGFNLQWAWSSSYVCSESFNSCK